jgi:acyl-CoA thioesterase-1
VAAAAGSAALSQINTLERNAGLILVEIGGNDVLGTTTAVKFEADLDRLLATLVQFSSDLVMFELPLPPLHNEFGRIQRELARKHSVKLVPKRILAAVLSESGVTIDSLHLSPQGHQRLAEDVWNIIGSAFASKT